MYRAIYAYAWDVADQPPAEYLAEWRDCGLDTLTLATSYHAGKFIRPRVANKVYFPEDGTVYFRARPERYGALKPQVNTLIQGRDVLAEYCACNDFKINGWTVLLHNTRLGMLHPGATVRNAFGDPYYYSLCPSNPDVRDYAVALCADLADGYDLAGLSLETPGFLPFVHGFHHEFAQLEQNPYLNTLLALCFCDHCRDGARQAGLDANGLQRWVAGKIDRYLASGIAPPAAMANEWWLAEVVADPELGEFLRWRCVQVTSLVAQIKSQLRAGVTLAVIPTVQRPTAATWLEGSDLAALATAADALEVPFYEPSPERVACDVWDVRERAGQSAPLRGILRPGPPDMRSPEQVRASIQALASAGVSDWGFYNYGLLQQHNLEWLRAALGWAAPG